MESKSSSYLRDIIISISYLVSEALAHFVALLLLSSEEVEDEESLPLAVDLCALLLTLGPQTTKGGKCVVHPCTHLCV